MDYSVDEKFLQAFDCAQDAVFLVDGSTGSLIKINRVARSWWGDVKEMSDIFADEVVQTLLSDSAVNSRGIAAKDVERQELQVFSLPLGHVDEQIFRLFVCRFQPSKRPARQSASSVARKQFNEDLIQSVSRTIKNTMQAIQLANEQTGANFCGSNELFQSVQKSFTLAEHMLALAPSLFSGSFVQSSKKSEAPDLSNNSSAVDLGGILRRLLPLFEFMVGRKVEIEIHPGSKGLCVRCVESNVGYLLLAVVDRCRHPAEDEYANPLRIRVVSRGQEVEVIFQDSGLLESNTQRRPQTSLLELSELIANEGGYLVEEQSDAFSRNYSLRFPNANGVPSAKEPSRKLVGLGRPVFLSSSDPNLLLNMRVAARKARIPMESGTAAPVSLFAQACRYSGWIVDLENADRATIAPILENLLDGPWPVPVILVEPSRSCTQSRTRSIIDRLGRAGAPVIRRPFQAEVIAELLLQISAKREKHNQAKMPGCGTRGRLA